MKNGRLQDYVLEIGGRSVPVRLRRNDRARRLILRADPNFASNEAAFVVTLPEGTGVKEALEWASLQGRWIEQQLNKFPDRVPFADGTVLPLRGVDHVIRHRPNARRGVWVTDKTICVSGLREHLARRVTDWLKKEARMRILQCARAKALELELDFGRVAIRDTKTRWGSCSSNGNLNFSWRLILTPDFVFDYVVAHEVAHLREHNHSSEFWCVVRGLTSEPERARAWLQSFGADLHCYG